MDFLRWVTHAGIPWDKIKTTVLMMQTSITFQQTVENKKSS